MVDQALSDQIAAVRVDIARLSEQVSGVGARIDVIASNHADHEARLRELEKINTAHLQADVDSLTTEVESLKSWRMKIVGIAAVFCFVATVFGDVILKQIGVG